MNGSRSPRPVSTTRAVVVAVFSTVAACALCGFAYNRLLGAPADKSPCVEVEDKSGARRESLARTLTVLAAERTVREASAKKPAPTPAAPPAAEAGGTIKELEISQEEVLARQKADAYTLDAQLASEEVDVQWAAKVERQMTDGIERLGPKMHLEDLTCRETLCRARITHGEPNARGEDVESLLSLSIFPGQAVAYGTPDDRRSTVLYFSRKGTTLSVLQPPVHMTLPPGALLEEPPSTTGLQ